MTKPDVRVFNSKAEAAEAAAGLIKEALPWDRAEFYWSDERYAPLTHPDSNYRAARDLLLTPLGIADAAVHRIATEAKDPAADARRYETALRARWPKSPARAAVPAGAPPVWLLDCEAARLL